MSRYSDAHATPQGPGDARPTALSIIKDEGLIGKLKGKVIMITGASSGIGIETARALHATGAHLYLAVRDVKRGKEVAKEIREADGGQSAPIDVVELHLDSLDSARACAADFLGKSKQLNILINNAGVMACPEGKTKDGFETQFGTNHLAHHLLFQLTKTALLASAAPGFCSRVVCLSSVGHRSSNIRFDDLDFRKEPYNRWVSYGQSKTANIYLANEIERRYGTQGLHATSVHPGGIATNLARHLEPDFLKGFDKPEINKHMKSPEQGAATTVWAAVSSEWEGKGGKYLENCSIAPPAKEGELSGFDPGYKPYAYDQEAAARLWELSNTLVGLPKDE